MTQVKASKQVQEVIVPKPVLAYGRLASASIQRVEGSEDKYVRLNVHVFHKDSVEPVSLTVSELFFEKAISSVVALEDGQLANHCLYKPVMLDLIRIPADGKTYGYVDKTSGEVVPYTVTDRVKLTGISGMLNDISEALSPDDRTQQYRQIKADFLEDVVLMNL